MENLLTKVYKNPALTKFLHFFCHLASVLYVAGFGGLLVWQLIDKEYVATLASVISAFVGFVLVTLMRKAIDAPRPYELYDFYEKKPKNKKGNSFPSRHAYSSFVIATLFFSQCTPIAIMLLVFALGMCISRVLLGIHFIRDVMAGALIGVIAAIAGLFLI